MNWPGLSPTREVKTRGRNAAAAEQAETGVTPDYIRLSIGIEDIDDIIGDLDQAIRASQA